MVGSGAAGFFQIVSLIQVIEENLNRLIVKDINLNITSNIIEVILLKIVGTFHSFTRGKTLLYHPTFDLHRIILKETGESNYNIKISFEVWLKPQFVNVIVDLFAVLLNLPFSVF